MKRLVIDTETTGLSPRFNKILTVGMLLVDVEKTHLDILDKSHIFIKHKHYNSQPEAMKVNKINLKEHTSYAISSEKACSQINKFVKKNSCQETLIVGHNIGFDERFLSALFAQTKVGYPFYNLREDTMKIWRTLQKQKLVPSHLRANLNSIATHFDIDYTKAHDALADCRITAQVYYEMLKVSPDYSSDNKNNHLGI